ncbi:MAG TPA: hypothetical protein GX694_10090 [Actinomycetales bacterium]|uniref:hypothetical protein n=1 Tax=Dietzia sp. 179-F 9C3 NHS TaxID=3374295 RepID=UPI00175A06A9|nr:hypothetical protein [Actinomycetales bacterium]
MDSVTGFAGSIATLVTDIIPNLIPQLLADPQMGLTLSMGMPVLSAGAVCELTPGCSSLQLPP